MSETSMLKESQSLTAEDKNGLVIVEVLRKYTLGCSKSSVLDVGYQTNGELEDGSDQWN